MRKNPLRTISILMTCVMTIALVSSCGVKNNEKEVSGISDVTDAMYSADFWTAKYKRATRCL